MASSLQSTLITVYKDGKLTTQAVDIVSHFKNTYIERSPSGTGLRIIRLVKTYTDVKELNAEIIRTFIEKIYVYGNEKPWDRNTKKLKVIFNFIGEVHIPSNIKKA